MTNRRLLGLLIVFALAFGALVGFAACADDDTAEPPGAEPDATQTPSDGAEATEPLEDTPADADGDLMEGVAEPQDASLQNEEEIQEGGVHQSYTSSSAPEDIVSGYASDLEGEGWSVQQAGGGGIGEFGGAGLTATHTDGRYLTFNAGGAEAETFIDLCVWPSQPSDTNCGDNNQNGDGDNNN